MTEALLMTELVRNMRAAEAVVIRSADIVGRNGLYRQPYKLSMESEVDIRGSLVSSNSHRKRGAAQL